MKPHCNKASVSLYTALRCRPSHTRRWACCNTVLRSTPHSPLYNIPLRSTSTIPALCPPDAHLVHPTQLSPTISLIPAPPSTSTMRPLFIILLPLLLWCLLLPSSTSAQSFGVQLIYEYLYGRQLAVDSAGSLYLAGKMFLGEGSPEDGVIKLSASGAGRLDFLDLGEYGLAANRVNQPFGVAVDSSYNVYVSSSTGNPARKFSANHTLLQTYDFSQLHYDTTGNTGLAVDSAGALYVCFMSTVVKFSTTGAAIQTFSASLSSPSGVVVENTTNALYVLDAGNSRIVKFSSGGVVLATQPYTNAAESTNNCYGIAIDPRDGTIVVACQPVQRFDTSLVPIANYTLPATVVGSGTNSASVYGAAVSSNGTIYITYGSAGNIVALHFELCPTGYSCAAGVGSATICPTGSYCPANQTAYGAQVLPCPVPSCCSTRGLTQPPPLCIAPSSSSSSSFSASSSSTAKASSSSISFTSSSSGRLSSSSSSSSSASTSVQSFGVQLIYEYLYGRQLAVDSAGSLYLAGKMFLGEGSPEDGVIKLSASGAGRLDFLDLGEYGLAANRVNQPFGVAVDSSYNVYVSSSTGNPARKFSANHTLLQTYDFSQLHYDTTGNTGLAVDSAGALYVCFMSTVVKFSTTGAAIQTFSASLSSPSGVVVENTTNALYVLDAGNSRIVKFSSGGVVLATQPYTNAAESTNNCYGIAIDPRDGTIVVACQPVQRFDTSLVPIANYTLPATVVGSGTNSASVYGAAVSSNGTIYITYGSAGNIVALHFELCPTGYSCAAGVGSATICPTGSYCPANQTAYGAQVVPCPIPSCCLIRGLTQPTCAASSSSSSSQPGSSSSIASSASGTVLSSMTPYSSISASSSGNVFSSSISSSSSGSLSTSSSSSSSSSGTSSSFSYSSSSSISSSSSSSSASSSPSSSTSSVPSTGAPALAVSHASRSAEYGMASLTFVMLVSLMVALLAW